MRININKVDLAKLEPDHSYLIEVDTQSLPVNERMDFLTKIHEEFKKLGLTNIITMEKGWIEVKDLGTLQDKNKVV